MQLCIAHKHALSIIVFIVQKQCLLSWHQPRLSQRNLKGLKNVKWIRLTAPLLLWVTRLQMSGLGWTRSTSAPDLSPKLFYKEPSIALTSRSANLSSPWALKAAYVCCSRMQVVSGKGCSSLAAWRAGDERFQQKQPGWRAVREISCCVPIIPSFSLLTGFISESLESLQNGVCTSRVIH